MEEGVWGWEALRRAGTTAVRNRERVDRFLHDLSGSGKRKARRKFPAVPT